MMNTTFEIKGTDQVSGLPRAISVGSWELTDAIGEAMTAIDSSGTSSATKP